VPLGLRLELVRVERALARKAGGLEHAGEMPRHSAGVFCENSPVSRIPNTRSSLSPKHGLLLEESDQLRQRDRGAELVAQPRLDFMRAPSSPSARR